VSSSADVAQPRSTQASFQPRSKPSWKREVEANADSRPAPHLDGCLDIDLESSVLTNAFPVRRLRLACGQGADAPGAYVRAEDLRVERLEQRYVRLENQDTGRRFAYAAPAFDFTCVLAYDDAGLLLDYPGIAVRAT
jgi:hypothetical protein